MTRKAGKAVSELKFCEKGQDVTLELRLVKDGNSFHYLVDHDDPKVYATDKDPNLLREKVFDELRKKLTISWEEVLLIQTELDFDRHSSSHGSHSSDRLEGLAGARSLKLAIHCFDVGQDHYGKPVYRHRDDPINPRFNPQHRIEYGDIMDCFGKGSRRAFAKIPDNAENRGKLRLICDAFDHLSARMRDVLGGEKILLTLANMASLPLLPAPPRAPGEEATDEDDD